MRKALTEIGKIELPLTGLLEITKDHRVNKPVYLYVVKNGKFELAATIK
jgi:branched-chain amino acid transport system substrate-binding protein